MYQKKDKSRIVKLTAAFFGAMILFTLLSRAVYQHGTAVVTAQAPASGVITHAVRATGKAVQNQELAVTTVGGLRVASVAVNEGQQVRAGDVLFTLDLDYLDETIQEQRWEMEKQRLSIQDAASGAYAAAQQRSNQKAQAHENYDAAVSQAETALERAERTLERAKKALENYYNGVTQDAQLEAELLQACQEAQSRRQAAETALKQLEEEIEREVRKALEQAAQDPANPTVLETEPTVPVTEPLPPVTAPTAPEAEPFSPETAPSVPETEPPAAPEAEELGWGGQGARITLLSARTGPSDADLQAVEAAVRASYAQRLAEAEAEEAQAKTEAEQAQAELDRYRAQQAGSEQPSEQALLAAVEDAQEHYDDARAALDNAKTSYGRAIQSAELPDGSNHSAQIGQISYDQMAAALEKLEALREQGGQILAPVDAVVTGCRVQTGEKTADTTAVLLADLSRGCKFSGTVTEEQSKYIGVGDLVTLTPSTGKKQYKDLPVTLLAPDGEKTYLVTVQLPENTLTLGASAELSFTRRSQPYNCCVPLSALHLDDKNQAYVLVAEEVKTVLGVQTQARKVPVTVLEQNDTSAALADGSLSQSQQVIVGADRPIDAGSRVRVS